MYGNESIISGDIENDRLLLNIHFYDKNGNLSFWMSRNRYWTISNRFTCYSERNSLYISEGVQIQDKCFLRLTSQNNEIVITGQCWIN